MAFGFEVFSPKSFQFWSSPALRPKRVFEALLVFPDLIFGGEGNQAIEPYLVNSFSRPGYNTIGTETSEYQLQSGDFAKIDYPTQQFSTKSLRVRLMDVAGFGKAGADTAGAIHASLAMTQKTMTFEHEAAASPEGKSTKAYNRLIGAFAAYPRLFFILELDGKGETGGAWEIWNPVLTSIDFSDVDYGGNQFATIDLTFDYKNFKFDQNWGERMLNQRLKTIEDSPTNLLTNGLTKVNNWWVNSVMGGAPGMGQIKPLGSVGEVSKVKQVKTG